MLLTRYFLFCAVVFFVAACEAPPAAVDVAYGDCATVIDGPVCMLPDSGELRVSVRTPEGGPFDVQQRLGKDWEPVVVLERSAAMNAQLLRVRVDRDARGLRVRVHEREAWRVDLGRESLPPYLAEIRPAVFAADTSGLDDAVSRLQRALQTPDIVRRGSAQGLLARAYLRQGNRVAAAAALRSAVDDNVAAGRRLEALRDTNVLVNVLYYKEARYDEVGALYARLGTLDPAPAEVAFFTGYNRGTAALDAGDSRVALAQLSAAGDVARRMGWSRRELDADQSLAVHLMQMGRRDAASEMLEGWRARGLPASLRSCEQAAVDVNLGWLALLQLEAGAAADDPTAALEAVQARVTEHCGLSDRVNGHVNLALAHYHAGRFAQARASLAAARTLTDSPGAIVQLWVHDVAGRIELGLGNLEAARAHLQELAALAQITLSQDGRWRAATGAARLSMAVGDDAGALAQFRAADRLLEHDLLRLPVDAGRDSLLASRQRARQDQMTLLLNMDRTRDALALALRHNSEVLATLGVARGTSDAAVDADALRRYRLARSELQAAVAASWTLPQDEKARLLARSRETEKALMALLDEALSGPASTPLAAPLEALAPGVVEVVFFARAGDWLTFVREGERIDVHTQSCDPAAALAGCLLAPLAPRLAHAKRLRLVPSGRLWSEDFHATVLDGSPLTDALPVAYALGLPQVETPRAPQALVVADSRGDLPFAREEMGIVRDGLSASSQLEFSGLSGREATSAQVLSALGRAGLFHFAGHARLAGYRGWQSELSLASATAITVPDVLALPAVPRHVVLSGCETAAAPDATAASIGLGQAFLVRGAQTVIAAVRPVDDQTTLLLMREFYARWPDDDDMAGALRAAQQSVRQQNPDADWAAFRAITR